jgi:phosphatidylserine/phosphatidylglycerophosphate/cardiolipin synthase-like enzyme
VKSFRIALILAFVFAAVACQRADQPPTLPSQDRTPAVELESQINGRSVNLSPVEVYFSPRGGCTDAVVRELKAAKRSVLIQAYSFTSRRIAKAILEAHERGVDVSAIFDKSNWTKNYSAADFAQHSDIPVLIDGNHVIAHNKVIIIDGQVVITGSFNFTRAAEESNAENLLVIRDKSIAEKYTANWKEHAQHSQRYGRTAAVQPGAVGNGDGQPDAVGDADGPLDPPAQEASVGYVASKNSGVFHRADCKDGKTIRPKNLIHFDTRDEAIQSGRTPCKLCNP